MRTDRQSASITLGSVDRRMTERVRLEDTEDNRSMEAEAKCMLEAIIASQGTPTEQHLYERVRARFVPLGGVDLDLAPRGPVREAPCFD